MEQKFNSTMRLWITADGFHEPILLTGVTIVHKITYKLKCVLIDIKIYLLIIWNFPCVEIFRTFMSSRTMCKLYYIVCYYIMVKTCLGG